MAPTNGMLRSLLFIYRSVGSFKFISTHLYGWRFCSSVSDNWNQAQWGIRGKEEGEFPEGKLLDLVVSSLRVDRVLASGLGMGRSKAGDLIAARKLYLNKEICQKASSEVKEGDEIDITKSKDCSEVELSRFKVLTIDQNHTKKNKRRLSGVKFARILMPRVEFDENYTEIGD